MSNLSRFTSNRELMITPVPGQILKPSQEDMEVLKCFDSVKISEAEDWMIGTTLNDAITNAYYHLGYKLPDDDEMIALQSYLVNFFKTSHSHQQIHVAELGLAIKRGSDNQYGEFYGINPATVTGWVRSYMQSLSRTNAKLVQQQTFLEAKKETKEPTVEEQKEAILTRLEELLENYRNGITILPTEASYYFDMLFKARVIRLSNEGRERLKREALSRLQATKHPSNAKSAAAHQRMKAEYDKIISQGLSGDAVKNEAMHLGLIDWFQTLIDFELTIRGEIV